MIRTCSFLFEWNVYNFSLWPEQRHDEWRKNNEIFNFQHRQHVEHPYNDTQHHRAKLSEGPHQNARLSIARMLCKPPPLHHHLDRRLSIGVGKHMFTWKAVALSMLASEEHHVCKCFLKTRVVTVPKNKRRMKELKSSQMMWWWTEYRAVNESTTRHCWRSYLLSNILSIFKIKNETTRMSQHFHIDSWISISQLTLSESLVESC